MADAPPVATLDAARCYPSQDEAALGVFANLPPKTRELAFAIYRVRGLDAAEQFCASIGIPGTNDNFAFRTEKGRSLAAIAHTHPAGADSDHFSPNDVKVAGALNKPSYILDQGANEVRRFDPGVSATRPAPRNGRLEAGAKISRGELVTPTRRDALIAAYDLHNPPTKP